MAALGSSAMLAAVGDLVEDVVVTQLGPLHLASDTSARIVRRRGGSASNVTAAAARRGARTRFIGQVGDDAIGRSLVGGLADEGVDVAPVRFHGETGTIVVLLDEHGERSMFTDRRAAIALDEPDPTWLDGVSTLHVPLYSLAEQPLASTSEALIGAAHDRAIDVSIDVSSESVIRSLGPSVVTELLVRLRPDVIFANADEARALGIRGPLAGAITVVKRGLQQAVVHDPRTTDTRVPAHDLGPVPDTTGAGDAFAAGFLSHRGWRRDPVGACRAGHAAAADHLTRADASPGATRAPR
jgi:sugar/nucleoside kinase (ribokinase family)